LKVKTESYLVFPFFYYWKVI